METLDSWVPLYKSFSISSNGTTKGLFLATRGLRQRSPLSPFLLTVVADSPSQVITNAEAIGIFRGFQVGIEKVNISLLQFANDTLYMMNRKQRNIQKLKMLNSVFRIISGPKVNQNTTHLSVISIAESECLQFANILGCVHKGWPSEYLDL